MYIGILNIVSAIVLSAVSAFFSVTGIRTIFSGAALAATFMGVSLEVSKIGSTLWLYSWWKKASRLLRYYLVFAVVMLVLISSLGIFAFLTSAYVGQEQQTAQLQTKITRIDERIERQQTDIARAETQLDQLNEAIDRYIELDVVSRALEQREQQAENRKQLQNSITNASNRIDDLRDEKYEIEQQIEQMQVDVGPIRYIAALLYGENNARDYYDNAARLFIVLLVLVFDPFAVLMMVSGNMAVDKAMKQRKRDKKKQQPRKQKQTKQTSSKKKTKQTRKKQSELPMSEKQESDSDKIVVDMSEYVNPEELRKAKESVDHTPLRKRKKQNKES